MVDLSVRLSVRRYTARSTRVSGDVDLDDRIELDPFALEHGIEGLGLRDRTREPVEQEPWGGIGFFQPFIHQPNDHRVGNERTAGHVLLRLQTERSPRFLCLAEHVTVEICGMPHFSQSTLACVPLPAPGGPRRINLIGRPPSRSVEMRHLGFGTGSLGVWEILFWEKNLFLPNSQTPCANLITTTSYSSSAGTGEAFVVARDEVRLDLAHRVERDADDDHDRGAAALERNAGSTALMMRRNDAHRRDVDRAAERDARQHAVDVLGRLLARADAGDVRLLLLQVVGDVDRPGT